MAFIPYDELDVLGSGIVSEFEKNAGCARAYVDIDGLAKSMGLKVKYAKFAEDDRSKDAFLSNGIDALKILKDGKKQKAVYPCRTIVLEESLLLPENEEKRRFSLAHELGHFIGDNHDPDSRFHSSYSDLEGISYEELQAKMHWSELQANNLAGILLLPTFKFAPLYKAVAGDRKLIRYDGRVFDPESRAKMWILAEAMKVSFSVVQYRLEKLGLFKKPPIDEYYSKYNLFNSDGEPYIMEACEDGLPF